MLESYFVRPQTIDKLRALWLGPAIVRYAEWLAARQTAKSTVLRDVQVLVEFNRFAQARVFGDGTIYPRLSMISSPTVFACMAGGVGQQSIGVPYFHSHEHPLSSCYVC